MIPAFDSRGLLPEGIHDATWLEVEQHFGFTPRRELLLQGLYRGLLSLKMAGCKTAFLDGSFVTQKPYPADFDVCWDGVGVNPDLLDPVLLSFANQRAEQKAKYGGEFLPAQATAMLNPRINYLIFFQLDKATHELKGIVRLDLTQLF